MNIQNKLIIKTIDLIFLIAGSVSSATLLASNTLTETAPLKQVMQQLIIDTNLLTKALILEDYQLIAQSANHIANHQKADIEIRKKLARAFGPEMSQFKGFDMQVHNAAVEIDSAAQKQDMKSILTNHSILIEGCQSCHNNFRERVIKVLKITP